MKTLFDPAGILPEPNHNTFFKCRVGISFAMKKEYTHKSPNYRTSQCVKYTCTRCNAEWSL